ncbi:hypothetical protein PMAYCL1PPCAC_28491 [Pristionchus mayeri]|uniref:Uncharacterized protein n=1 Tax=Pristionchus mayeri TaxID=1317129 RepID=A0AAN5D7K8_9BILA|nr:hypothetical protein PMAYCL1PPCAC_28491 [Pristionchus mayeri]
MRGLALRPGGESRPLVALGELDGEVGDERLKAVVAPHSQHKIGGPREIEYLNSVEVDLLDAVAVGHNSVAPYSINKGLSDCHLANGRHVEAVHFVPPVNLLILVLPVLDAVTKSLALSGKSRPPGASYLSRA